VSARSLHGLDRHTPRSKEATLNFDEVTDPLSTMNALKKQEADTRAALEARRVAIKKERKDAAAKWNAEDAQIREALRTRPKTTRKPKSSTA
jgi:hypothetical protein